MRPVLEDRRIALFVILAFAIAWLIALAIYLTGGLVNSPQIVPGISLAVLLLSGPYMFAPAIAHILTRLFTREGWKNTTLGFNFRRGWPWWLVAWFLPGILTLAGAALYFLIYPGHMDLSLPILKQMGVPDVIPYAAVGILQVAQGFLLAPINIPFTFGEEFGWRGYLQHKLLPLGPRKMLLWMGLIWGAWHWPVIWMGYEYGFKYPGYPWAGPLLFCWIAFCLGVLLSWVSLRGGSVWPAVIGHAAINAMAGVGVLALALEAQNNPLLGPLPVGVIGGAGFGILALILWLVAPAWAKPAEPAP